MSNPVVVCDASALVALLLAGDDGRWAESELTDRTLTAPHLLTFECANIIRRHALAGRITDDHAQLAHRELLEFPVELWPYESLSTKAWKHRNNLSIYDAAYVALAETLDAPLVTLDRRLGNAPGLTCVVRTPA